MKKTTATGAGNENNITFKDKMHEKFYLLYLPECTHQDVYHKALIYCLGMNRDTRENVERIFDFMTSCVKPECLKEGWQTSGSLRVVRMAFAANVRIKKEFTGSVYLKKISANTVITSNNDCYSLSGAEYGVYSDSSCKTKVGTLTTNASGESNTLEVNAGNYWVKETKAPKGFVLDPNVYKVTVTSGKTATVSVQDIPTMDPVGILLGKVDRETNQNKPQGSASLQGALFTVKYYKDLYDTDPAEQGKTPERTWVFRTDSDGFCEYQKEYFVSGDELYYAASGDPSLPLGTITIQETQAPEGYLINPEIYVAKITSNNTGQEFVYTYNEPTVPETVLQLDIVKILKDTEQVIPGAVFKHTSPDGSMQEIKTDKNGKAVIKGLTWGTHTIEEVSVPDGFTVNPGKVIFNVEKGNKITVMPDLNPDDGFIQLAIYGDDKEKFQAWFTRYLMSRMQGGKHQKQDLINLTGGNTSIISVPFEKNKRLIQSDFDKLGINYAVLPDLRVGDGEIQIMVANADMPKVEHWYQLYQEQQLSRGKDVKDLSPVSMEQYAKTAEMTEEQYVDTASLELKKKMEKYEGRKPGEIEQSVRKREQRIHLATDEGYQRLHSDPSYVEITINRETLVEKSTYAGTLASEKYGLFASRIPGTWGKGEKTLVLPSDQVFKLDDGKTYLAFLKKDERPLILGANGKPIPRNSREKGMELYRKHYAPADRKVRHLEPLEKAERRVKKQTGKAMEDRFPANPVKTR